MVMGGGWCLVADYYKRANFKKQEKKLEITDYFKKSKVA